MKEYITRFAALQAVGDIHPLDYNGQGIVARIKAIPAAAADVVEVRHGRWIKDNETGEPICSICYSGKPTRAVCSSVIEHKLNNHEIRYCYYCGAKMDGGQDE